MKIYYFYFQILLHEFENVSKKCYYVLNQFTYGRTCRTHPLFLTSRYTSER